MGGEARCWVNDATGNVYDGAGYPGDGWTLYQNVQTCPPPNSSAPEPAPESAASAGDIMRQCFACVGDGGDGYFGENGQCASDPFTFDFGSAVCSAHGMQRGEVFDSWANDGGHACCTSQSNNLVLESECDLDDLTEACNNVQTDDSAFCVSQCHTLAVSMQSSCSLSADAVVVAAIQEFLGNCAKSGGKSAHH